MTLFTHYFEYCAWFGPMLWVWFLFLGTIFKLNVPLPHASRTTCSPVLFSPSFTSLNCSPILFVIILPASHSSKSVSGTLEFGSDAVMLTAVRIIAKKCADLYRFDKSLFSTCMNTELGKNTKVAWVWCKTGRNSLLLKMPGFFFLLGWVVLGFFLAKV